MENPPGNSKLPPGTELEIKNGKTTKYKLTSTGKLVDDALDAIEKENPKLKGVLNKAYTQLQLDPDNFRGLIDLVAIHPVRARRPARQRYSRPRLRIFPRPVRPRGRKQGGQYFTPKAIVTLIVEMLEPYSGRVYDPACGSGGFFVPSERFIEEHGGKLGQISVYGQESNPTTWRLAAMNMAIRGIDFNFGKDPANSFTTTNIPISGRIS